MLPRQRPLTISPAGGLYRAAGFSACDRPACPSAASASPCGVRKALSRPRRGGCASGRKGRGREERTGLEKRAGPSDGPCSLVPAWLGGKGEQEAPDVSCSSPSCAPSRTTVQAPRPATSLGLRVPAARPPLATSGLGAQKWPVRRRDSRYGFQPRLPAPAGVSLPLPLPGFSHPRRGPTRARPRSTSVGP